MQLELQNVGYSYNGKELVLRHVNYRFEGGRIYAITGRSGAGKTTLLSLLSQLTKPTEGKILYNGLAVSEVDQYLYRSQYAGVIFQSFNLLMHLTAVENVMLSMDIAGVKKENNRAYAMELLEKVGLSKEESQRRILKLSGGLIANLTISFDIWKAALPMFEIYGTEGTLSAPDPNMSSGMPEVTRKETVLADRTAAAEPLNRSFPDEEELRRLYPETAEYKRGVGALELAMAINENRPARAVMDLVCHVLEAINGIMEAAKSGGCYYMKTTCGRPEPLIEGNSAGEVRQNRK